MSFCTEDQAGGLADLVCSAPLAFGLRGLNGPRRGGSHVGRVGENEAGGLANPVNLDHGPGVPASGWV